MSERRPSAPAARSPGVRSALFRFYEELNFFLPAERRKRDFPYFFKGHPAVKDAIEAIGVPHTEVELILVNGASVGFDYQLQPGDRVSVYPMFESFDLSPIVKLRDKPLRRPKFICDVHLGKLATILRLLGFDTLYRNDYDDEEIIETAVREQRIILTCDRGILKHSVVTHGCCLRSRQVTQQIREVLQRFDLYKLAEPFSRCTVCNGRLVEVKKERVLDRLPPRVAKSYNRFKRCSGCDRIYWRGSHFERIKQKLAGILESNAVD